MAAGARDRAKAVLQRGLQIERELGNPHGQGIAHSGLGFLHTEDGDNAAAIEHLQDSLLLYRETEERMGIGFVLDRLARTYASMERFDDAVETFQQAIEHRRAIKHRRGEASSLRGLGATLKTKNDVPGAKSCWQQALQIFEELDPAEAEQVRKLLISV